MSIQNTRQIFVGNGGALGSTGADFAGTVANGLDVVTYNMKSILAATETISSSPYLTIFNKLANGQLKKSNLIKGTSVTKYEGQPYAPSTRGVWSIGYNRGAVTNLGTTTAGGSISVSNSTDYVLNIRFKNDKSFYSVRPEVLRVEFTSAAAATQSSICDQIVLAINNSGFGSSVSGVKEIKAVKVGDNATTGGNYGVSGATNFGVEIWGLTINQFQNTQYGVEVVKFSCHVDDSSGFSTTACLELQAASNGTGTYDQVYNLENFAQGVEGVLNRVTWPVPTLQYNSNSSGFTSGTLTNPTSGTVTAAIGLDRVVFGSAANTQLPAGSLFNINGGATFYEVKYYISSTVAITTELGAVATGVVTGKAFYDLINITVADTTIQDGSGVSQVSYKSFVIATPAIVATSSVNMTTPSTEGAALKAALDNWMSTTPLAPAAITI